MQQMRRLGPQPFFFGPGPTIVDLFGFIDAWKKFGTETATSKYPIGPMYGTFTYINCCFLMINVGKYIPYMDGTGHGRYIYIYVYTM